MTAAAPPLAADLTEGLRRLKLAAMRRLAPELLLTARTQRWAPEELLRTLVEAEISARDASNARTRLKAAAFPVTKTLDEFDLGVSSVPPAPSPTWPRWNGSRPGRTCAWSARPGTGKSHLLVALGAAAVAAGHKVRYYTAAELTETLYRGLADNSVGRVIDTLLRNDLILIDEVGSRRWMTPARSCCSAWSRPPTNAAPWESPATGPSISGAGSCPSTPPPSACWTGCCTTRMSSSPTAIPTGCAKPEPGKESP